MGINDTNNTIITLLTTAFFLKVHLNPILFYFILFFSLKRIYLLFKILLRKNFWIRLNPRFSVPRRNLENSFKTPPFCFATEFEENGSSGCCDVYPGRLDISITSSHFLQDGAIHIRKVRRNAFQRCYWLLQQYPRFKERYTVQFTAMIG